ncbi:MAG TPA: lysophospholipid acyltransferase family protein [Pirellulales bacterium]|nr:lysophospholipid acyltransferase family protein [Pirellulales bacterium]
MFSDQTTHRLAIAVLAVMALALAVWTVRGYRRTRFTPAQFPIYMYNYFMTRVMWRARIQGAVPLPPQQGAVIVCNHRSPIDPGFVALACDRPVHWMVAREYVHHPLVGWGLRILQVIPVGRAGIDTAATKLAMRYAQRGDLVGMFPEGRINSTERFMLPGRPGAAMVALKARVPVIPCYIEGSPFDGTVFSFFFMLAKTRLVIGQPIDISEYYERVGDRRVLECLTRRFMREIARLAGRDDFEPELAGKRWNPQ